MKKKNKVTKKTVGIQQGLPDFIELMPRVGINERVGLVMQTVLQEAGQVAMVASFEAFKVIGAKFVVPCLTPRGKGVAFFENFDDKTPMGIGIVC